MQYAPVAESGSKRPPRSALPPSTGIQGLVSRAGSLGFASRGLPPRPLRARECVKRAGNFLNFAPQQLALLFIWDGARWTTPERAR
jgi:hypothetical protein